MNMRTRKKILTNSKHPRHKAAVRAMYRALEDYGKAECRTPGTSSPSSLTACTSARAGSFTSRFFSPR